MRILLAQSTVYVPTHGGENKANRLLVEGLAARGHECRVISPALGAQGPGARAQFLEALSSRGLSVRASGDGVDVFTQHGVEVHAVGESAQLRRRLAQQIEAFQPTWTLISSEDPGQVLLETAVKAAPRRVVYVAHTMLFFPCGPNSFVASAAQTALLRQTAGIITVSQYLQRYLRQWAGCESVVIPFPVYGNGPFPQCGEADKGCITLINPCAYKGLPIFLELARRFPAAPFLAVPSWGTTARDRQALAARPNVQVMGAVDNIDEIFARTRVLLVPSLWGEGFPLVPVEAMLRGVPVLASDSGGLPEAKLGVDYVLPVRPIVQYQPQFDDRQLPVAIVPDQDVAPWAAALGRLVSERAHYAALSTASRAAADAYVAGLGIAPFEAYLERLAHAATPAGAAVSSPPVALAAAPGADAARDLLQQVEKLSPERRALLARRLQSKTPAQSVATIHRGPAKRAYPASFAQERLWLLEQWEPGSAAYHNLDAFRLHGPLNREALVRSLNEMIRRHESLRTTFAEEDGRPLQVIAPMLQLMLAEVGRPSSERRETEAEQEWIRCQILEEAHKPFDLTQGPLVRATLLTLGNEDHILILTTHHIISDGWSGGVIFYELAGLYRAFSQGQVPALPEPPIQYADFSQWQRESLRGDALNRHLSHWKAELAGAPNVLELPTDRRRPVVQTFRGARRSVLLPALLTERLKALGRERGVTLFMTLLAGFKVLLYRYTGQTDIIVGTAMAGRQPRETEGLIGFFVNSLPLRTRLSGDVSFGELLRRVRQSVLNASIHQDLPFAKLVQELQPTRSLSHNPIFQVMFVLQNTPREPLALSGLSLSVLPVDSGTAKFDLTLDITEESEGLLCSFEYNTDLFDAETVTRMLGHYHTLLEAVAQDAETTVTQLPILTAMERRQLVVEWNDTGRAYPMDRCLHHLFEAQARKTPEAIAAVFEHERLTYAALDRRANQLAHHLTGCGVGPEVLVGVCMERSLEMLIGMLGILKAGGAYVPLDPAYPADRLAFVLKDAEMPVVVTQQRLTGRLNDQRTRLVCIDSDWPMIARESESAPGGDVCPTNLAYVIYTSGSTGTPKGVAIEHHSPVTLVHWALEVFTPARLAGVLASTSICFDLSVFEVFVPLSSGGTVILAENALQWPALPAAREVTLINTVPSAMTELVRLEDGPRGVPTVNLAGEALQQGLVRAIYEQFGAREVFNLYGPTEDTTYSTFALVQSASASPPIGRPIANTQIYLLDANLQLVPVGIPGEIYIGGDGLARGYLNRPDATSDRFVSHDVGEGQRVRLYRTGDLGRYLPDGTLEYLGRRDYQVKVRGYRIELGEIEAVLARHPALAEIVVAARDDSPGGKYLVAYLVARRSPPPSHGELRSFLSDTLPAYMVPTVFVWLDHLPLTPNGKVDRAALPAPDEGRLDVRKAVEVPTTQAERHVAGIWSELLGIKQVGLQENFFELGGHSLLAMQVISRVRRTLQVEVPLRALFERPTVAGLASLIEELTVADGELPAAPIPRRRREVRRASPGSHTLFSTNG